MMLRTLLCACFASAWPHDAWSSCNRLLEARYYETSLLACTGLACVGDGLAQAIEHRRDHRRARARSEAPPPGRAPRLDRARMRDFAVSSALVDGALTPVYYEYVERLLPGPGLPAVSAKAFIGSAVFGPVSNGAFLVLLAALPRVWRSSRAAADAICWETLRKQLLIITIRDFQMYPPFEFVNFMVVPRRWRPVAVALMTLVFNVVCSMTAFADETKLPPWFESARAKWAQLRAQAENPPRAAPQ